MKIQSKRREKAMSYSYCQIPLCHMPFSRYGAYLAISSESGGKELILHDVRKSFGEDQIYKIYGSRSGNRY